MEPETGWLPEERLKAMEGPLLSWYEGHARILPWREQPEPYRVWVSEIMLQQTRVEAVKPYFHRFMSALPQISDLAQVEEDRLLKLWEGLGYYNRARNLKKAAQILVNEYRGQLPKSCEALLKLPGIGSYTAGAIASIAYDIPVPAVDGNVLRVISRVLGSREDISKQSVKRKMERLLSKVIPSNDASRYNQGLIEIGAVVCIPNGAPLCGDCPLAFLCAARREGLTGEIPVKAPKKERKKEKRTVFLIWNHGRIALRKRPDKGLLAGLYEFPNVEGWIEENDVGRCLEGKPSKIVALPQSKHIFSHVEWHMKAYEIFMPSYAGKAYLWADPEELKEKYSLPGAFKAYTELVR